ncbi:FxLYD domain-containing protein [Patescibacteria group bacterium]|nr:FxLYD domain-containing protein [Patescibacteria group bacterium]
MPFGIGKKPEEPLSPLDQRKKQVEAKEQDIDKEYDRKLFIVKYKRPFIYGAIAVILGIVLTIGIINGAKYIESFFPEEDTTPIVEEEKPSADFKITSKDVTIISETDDSYDVFMRLVNTDPVWGVSKLAYTVVLKDAAGQEVGRKSGTTYSAPRSTRTLAVLGVDVAAEPASIEVLLDPVMVQKLKDFGSIQLTLKNVRYEDFRGRGRVTGTLVNDSPFSFNQVDLDVVLFNKQQEIVGINHTNVNAIRSGEERDFVVTWPDYLGESTQAIVEPSVDVFSSSAFMNEYQEGQELSY